MRSAWSWSLGAVMLIAALGAAAPAARAQAGSSPVPPGARAPAPPAAPGAPRGETQGWIPAGGYLPIELQARLAGVETAEVSRACGNLESPWGYRGKAGRRLALRDYGRRAVTPEQAKRLAGWLAAAPLDTVYLAPGAMIPCEAGHAAPVYLVRFSGNTRPTWALMRFDIGAVVLFDSELPMGLVLMQDRADTIWTALAEMFEDDPAFRNPRPEPRPLRGRGVVHDTTAGGMRPDYSWVQELPQPVERVAPVYPEEARRQLVEGIVWVQVLVGQDGGVRDAIVRSGPPPLRDAALDAIWQWHFKPGAEQSSPLAMWVLIPVKFSLN